MGRVRRGLGELRWGVRIGGRSLNRREKTNLENAEIAEARRDRGETPFTTKGTGIAEESGKSECSVKIRLGRFLRG
jgi:hypothetical protein